GPSGSSPLARWPALLATRSVTYKNHRGLGSGSSRRALVPPLSGLACAVTCLVSGWAVCDRSIRRRAAVANGGGIDVGAGPEAHRASLRLLRQVESELSFPPSGLLGLLRRPRPSGLTGRTVRRSKSKRLTYCFDRPRVRTLGSLPAVPETP